MPLFRSSALLKRDSNTGVFCKHSEIFTQSDVQKCSVKKVFLEVSQNSQEDTWGCNFIKKETLAQVFSCEFCKISKNTFLYRTPPVTASSYFEVHLRTAASERKFTWTFFSQDVFSKIKQKKPRSNTRL